jgi:hypothetical protein
MKNIWGSRGHSGADLRNPFRPITKDIRTIVLSYTSSYSTGGITKAHSLILGGVQTPGGDIRRSKGQIFSPTVIRISLKARVHILRQFPSQSDGYHHQGEFFGFHNSYRELPNCFLLIYPCMRKPTPVLLVTSISYFLFCNPVLSMRSN